MTLKAPSAVFREVPDVFKTGDSVEVWWNDTYGEWVIEGNRVTVVTVHLEKETLDGFVFHEDDSREYRTGIPFQCCELLYRHEIEAAERNKTQRAMDRFADRFMAHAERPGGVKPGHTVTRETAMDIARNCAHRADRRSSK